MAISNGMCVVLFETYYKSLSKALVTSNAPLNELDGLVSQCGNLTY